MSEAGLHFQSAREDSIGVHAVGKFGPRGQCPRILDEPSSVQHDLWRDKTTAASRRQLSATVMVSESARRRQCAHLCLLYVPLPILLTHKACKLVIMQISMHLIGSR